MMRGRDYVRATLCGIVAGWIVTLALIAAVHALALHCARASDGTDGSIAACYTGLGLAVPDDL
jgi:hypothetical protein